MGRMLLLVLCGLFLMGCDVLKGPKGDKGDSGASTLLTTKIYRGTPTANPYSVSTPEITDADNQVVLVYLMLSGGVKVLVPYSDSSDLHYYLGIRGTRTNRKNLRRAAVCLSRTKTFVEHRYIAPDKCGAQPGA